MTQASMSWRLRFSLVTDVEYTLTAMPQLPGDTWASGRPRAEPPRARGVGGSPPAHLQGGLGRLHPLHGRRGRGLGAPTCLACHRAPRQPSQSGGGTPAPGTSKGRSHSWGGVSRDSPPSAPPSCHLLVWPVGLEWVGRTQEPPSPLPAPLRPPLGSKGCCGGAGPSTMRSTPWLQAVLAGSRPHPTHSPCPCPPVGALPPHGVLPEGDDGGLRGWGGRAGQQQQGAHRAGGGLRERAWRERLENQWGRRPPLPACSGCRSALAARPPRGTEPGDGRTDVPAAGLSRPPPSAHLSDGGLGNCTPCGQLPARLQRAGGLGQPPGLTAREAPAPGREWGLLPQHPPCPEQPQPCVRPGSIPQMQPRPCPS